MSTEPLTERVRAGDPRAIARAITLVENETADGRTLLAEMYQGGGGAYLIGVTGPPGSGKSTLVDGLTGVARRAGLRVGVIAVDPSSPFTGGAVLGDRVRMSAHAGDPDVFIRSMATRGHLGGLARATSDAVVVLDAAGKAVVIIETVGVGQDEVDIVQAADLSIVVLVPGTGDDVQALKAGIMEIADIFVVNKADLDGADRLVQAIVTTLALRPRSADQWEPPIVRTVATASSGLDELWRQVQRYRDQPAARRAGRGRARQDRKLRDLLAQRFLEQVDRTVADEEWQRLVDSIARREADPYSVAAMLFERVGSARRSPA